LSRSIYWKITIPLIAFSLLTMGSLGFYMVNSTRDILVNRLESRLVNEARLVADLSMPGFADPAKNGSLDPLAKSIGGEIGVRITLIAPDGIVLGDTDQDPTTLENHSTRPEVVAALASGVGQAIRYSATLHENMMYVAVPVTNNGKVIGISRVALPFTTVDSSINNTVITTIVGALGLATLLVIIATVIITRLITRPVRQLTRAAEAIASGKLEQQITIHSRDEIARLGRAFNEMSSSVKNSMGVISDERSQLVAVLSGLTDGVVMTDPRGRIVLSNPAAKRLFNFKDANVIGRPLIEAVHDHEIDAALKKCLETAREQSVQIDSVSGRFVRAIAVPITAGKITGALILFQDLTELRGLQTMRREFVGNISHELRTPLAAIKAIVETLRDGAINDREASADFLNRLDVEVDGMTQMVSEIIELSRIETGKIKLKPEPVDLNSLIQEIITRLSPQANRQQLSLSADLLSGLPAVMADRERIQQVITNIVHNAIKFTPVGGRIVVSTKVDGQSVVTSVSDTGIGISREDLPHIFERFFKADKSRSTSGTGLGLAIARHIVQNHGGSVWVQSEQGKGSTFGFNLPLNTNTSKI
jgi:two-component system, OmpR family, phosphate regulon sensor histidine kinase PhoR